MQLLIKANECIVRTEEELKQMEANVERDYGKTLTSLGYDWQNDPQMKDTPRRWAKMMIRETLSGSNTEEPKITAFPNTDGYTGIILQEKIALKSTCAHHHRTFKGLAHIAYIPGKKEDGGMVLGLSKLNRIARWYAKRFQIQESLTKQIHDFVNKKAEGNRGVAVIVEAQHNCVGCRGVEDDSVMKTSELSGYFFTNQVGTRVELFGLKERSNFN